MDDFFRYTNARPAGAKQPLALAVTAFCLTVLLLWGAAACLLADWNSRQTAFPTQPGLFSVEPRKDSVQITLLGHTAGIRRKDLSPRIARLERYRAFLPKGLRLTLDGFFWGWYATALL